MSSYSLNNGMTIPAVGLGTWDGSFEGEVKAAVIASIKAGYRHIDCAYYYKNEKEIGEAFSEVLGSGLVKRSDLFVTSKLWNDSHAETAVENSVRKTLSDLQLDYLDLYLIHWPVTGVEAEVLTPSTQETWLAMESLVNKGLVKSIGVSNFTEKKLRDMKRYATIFPAVNQVEVHPLWRQTELIQACKELGVHVTAYSPLGSPGGADIFDYKGIPLLQLPIVHTIAQEINAATLTNKEDTSATEVVTPAQVLLRWGLQRGLSVIPKSSQPSRIVSNFSLSHFTLSDAQMERLSTITEPAQCRIIHGHFWLNKNGPYRTMAELWDEEV